jgi:hypothetical protein
MHHNINQGTPLSKSSPSPPRHMCVVVRLLLVVLVAFRVRGLLLVTLSGGPATKTIGCAGATPHSGILAQSFLDLNNS